MIIHSTVEDSFICGTLASLRSMNLDISSHSWIHLGSKNVMFCGYYNDPELDVWSKCILHYICKQYISPNHELTLEWGGTTQEVMSLVNFIFDSHDLDERNTRESALTPFGALRSDFVYLARNGFYAIDLFRVIHVKAAWITLSRPIWCPVSLLFWTPISEKL